jgi:hypothetical protein
MHFSSSLLKSHSGYVTLFCLIVPGCHIFCNSTPNALAGLTNSLLCIVPGTQHFTLRSFIPHSLNWSHCFTLWHFAPVHSAHCETDSATSDWCKQIAIFIILSLFLDYSRQLSFQVVPQGTGIWGKGSRGRKSVKFVCVMTRLFQLQ